MCGRFTLFLSRAEIERFFDVLTVPFDLQPNYNVAPTQEIPVIIQQEDARHLRKFRWGLVPFWAKDTAIGSRMINARVETASSKPAFKSAFRHRRCLIPANGFYEWQGKAGSKQPFYFHFPAGEPMAFAGLWETWQDKSAPDASEPYQSCTIITTEASEWVRDVHDRMPLILKPEGYGEWLDPENKDAESIERILETGSVRDLQRYPVSKLVNRVESNSKACVEPIEKG
jgi:putative SOS response-associated peptidase YedK